MVTRFALTAPIEAVRTAFAVAGGMPYPPRYNIAPTQPVSIVRLKPGIEASGIREIALVRWGLIPHWVKDPGTFATLASARAETILEKPSFRTPMRHRRCIVPADAFYEWAGKTGARVPHLIRMRRQPSPPMALAGLWDHWLGREGSEMETLALVSRAAAGTLAAVSDRMPVLLEGPAVDAWLDVRGTDEGEAADLLDAPPADVLETFEIGPAINDPTRDSPDVQTRLPDAVRTGLTPR